jgi:hypothetical protein
MKKFIRLITLAFLVVASASTALAVPAAPVNTPRAHPLAPNPHTSVGLFWIYTDANTGRQWTGGTYKVKRCSGAACTPSTVVASGLTNADYQDTGLSSNTVYGYRYLANDGADSSDSPTVYVTTLAADSNYVQWPNTTWEALLGPLVESAQIPFAFFRDTMTAQGADVISKFPVVGPAGFVKGTASVTHGSAVVTGTGTFFLEQVAANNPTCWDGIAFGGTSAGAIASVDSNTQITLSTPWAGSTQSGLTISTNVAGLCGAADPINDFLTGNQLMYYDSPMALWQVYFMTGDPQYLRGAIKGSEAVFAGFMWLGRNRAWNDYAITAGDNGMPAPRNFQFSGYLLLGMAGHKGVWDLLDDYLNRVYAAWVGNYAGGNNNFTYPREKAYMVLFTSWFVMAAPDSFPRSDGTTTSLNGTTTVDGDLVDGRKDFWRDKLNVDVPGFITDDQRPDGHWTDNGGSNATADGDYPYVGGTEITGPAQPFVQGLMADALGYCWRNTALSSTARNAARRLVLRSAAAMGHLSYNTNVIAQDTTKRWRTIWYFMLGGTRLNPYAFQHGADSFVLNDTPYSNAAILNRQSIPLMLSSFGWAWEMSGHTWYKTQGNEMANAAFAAVGENDGGTGDGLKSLCNSDANYKDYGQCFRTAARYFGHRLATPSSLGTAPVVTMPSDQTLTGGVNQAALTASVSCTNTPCTYRWGLQEFPLVNNPRYEPMPVFTDAQALSAKLCGLESGTYKLIFYALDSLGLEGHGTVSMTVGDGVFPPVAVIGYGSPSAEEQHQYFTTSGSLAGSVRAYSIAGRSLTHSFTVTKPKDKSAPTFTPSGTTGNVVTFTISGLSAGLYTITDTITDSGGAVRRTHMYIRHTAEAQPNSAHNTIPQVSKPPDHVLPAGSTSTRLYVTPRDPEGIVGYTPSASGYTQGELGAELYLVTALTHSWTQTAGPVSATITNGSTIRPDITGLSAAGTYTFRYTGTDQQGDSVTADINVTAGGGAPVRTIEGGREALGGRAGDVRDAAVSIILAILFALWGAQAQPIIAVEVYDSAGSPVYRALVKVQAAGESDGWVQWRKCIALSVELETHL